MAEMSQVEALAETSSQANEPKDSRPVYEAGFHVVPTVDDAKAREIADTLRSEILKIGGEVISEQAPQKMTLSYVIERAAAGKREKFGESYFGWIKFAIEERSNLPQLESYLQHNREILRFLLIQSVREEAPVQRRAIFSSNRLEGETIKKPTATPEEGGEVSEEDLDKSIEAIVG
jgi:ribosomal protein S6